MVDGYQVTTHADAVERYRLVGLPRPAVDQVRVVSGATTIEGDFCLDRDEDSDALFQGAWVFLDGLTVSGALTNSEMDGGPVLGVRGTLAVRIWWLTGIAARVWGDLQVERLLLCEYNHGSLRVDGRTRAPVVVVLDHDTTLAGPLDGVLLDGEQAACASLESICIDEDRVDREALVARARRGFPLLAAQSPAAAAAAPTEDPAYLAARKLTEHWATTQAVVFVEGVSYDDFADKVARKLHSLRHHPAPGSALGEWLLERREVDDVFASDDELLP